MKFMKKNNKEPDDFCTSDGKMYLFCSKGDLDDSRFRMITWEL